MIYKFNIIIYIEENFAISAKDKEAARAFDSGDFQGAQALGDEARIMEQEKVRKDKSFELVQRCAKDAQSNIRNVDIICLRITTLFFPT